MQTLHDIMRDRLLVNVIAQESWPDPGQQPIDFKALQGTEWVPEFEKLMRNRLIMGAYRYELMACKRISFEYDLATEAKARIDRFIESGNIEHLVDASNMCMIEFEFSNHPNKHYESVDDGEHAKRLK